MITVTIPKELSKNQDLVAVPRDVYEDFLAWQKKIKSLKTFKPTKADKQALQRGRKNFLKKDYITLEELTHELEHNN
jgi:hypothetical protein